MSDEAPRAFDEFPDSYIFEAHETADGHTFWIDNFVIPNGERGKGEGRAFYLAFEAWLTAKADRSVVVRLFAADEGSGPSGGFWIKMGFAFEAGAGNDERGYMSKTVAPRRSPRSSAPRLRS